MLASLERLGRLREDTSTRLSTRHAWRRAPQWARGSSFYGKRCRHSGTLAAKAGKTQRRHVDTLENTSRRCGGQVGNLPHLVFSAIGGSAWRCPTNMTVDAARLEACATMGAKLLFLWQEMSLWNIAAKPGKKTRRHSRKHLATLLRAGRGPTPLT